MKIVRDPVHGDIEIEDWLLTIIDNPDFQRLKGVRQLGAAHWVYPGAMHTRFDHSLGVYWRTFCLLKSILTRQKELSCPPLHRKAILASALLHDITHTPFGHTIEDERKLFERHDTEGRFRRYFKKSSIGAYLQSQGIKELVLSILCQSKELPLWYYHLFSGTIGADLLDYLERDAYFCGVRGGFDERIVSSFRVDAKSGELYLIAHKDGILSLDVFSEVVTLLRMRYVLSERVYFHHTKVAFGAMISKAVEQALTLGFDREQLDKLTDDNLLYVLRHQFSSQDPQLKLLLEALASRSVYKRAFVVTRDVGDKRRKKLVERFHQDPLERSRLESEIIKHFGWKPGELIVYCPAFEMQLKEAEILLEVEEGRRCKMSALGDLEIEALKQKHQDLWKFYLFVHPRRAKMIEKLSHWVEEKLLLNNELASLASSQLFFKNL